MLVSEKKIDFPDECLSDKCPVPKGDRFWDIGQGSICIRCPIFCCQKIDDKIGSMVEPEGYRPDWALLWKNLFEGKIRYEDFELPLRQTKGEMKDGVGI